MMKLLLLAAILANALLVSSGSSSSSQSSSSSSSNSSTSSTSSSQSSSSSSSYSSTAENGTGDCSGDNNNGGVNPKKCGANETYLECPEAHCVPKKCSELGFPIACPDQPQDGSCPGGPGCVCVDGFVRDDNDVCIPVSECPSCAGDENKRAGCGVYCNQHCSDIDAEDPKMCIAICYDNACDCKPGFYLNSKGDCVKPDQCDVSPTCKENEVFSNCTNGGCSARNCSQLGMPIPCVKLDPAACKKGCVCDDGYLRADNGTCIPQNQCPSCGGDPNAKPGCGVNCGKRCSTYKTKSPICPLICKLNGCDCKDKYVFDDNLGKCVLPKDCTPTCQVNEVFSNCTNGGCSARNCSQLGTPIPCVKLNPAACKKGCVCKKDYLRAANGTCIPKTECQKCGANETYLECPEDQCVPRKCSELGFPVACPGQTPDGSCAGRPGCVCIDGFVKDDNDVCIPVSECPSCAGDENKRAGCGVYCNQHCSDIDAEDPKMCIAICYNNACDCKPGFYLNSKGDCVKPDQCDVSPTCKKNEVFSNCTNGGCSARNCSQLGMPIPCVKLDPAACKKGCICVDGYLRADNGTCIPENQCPSCGGDPNAKPGCGVNCGKRCSTYKTKSPICPLICKLNGCDCKDKYVFDDNLGKCVLPKDCTPTCQVNEVFSNCTNGGCSARNCSQLGTPIPCVKLNPAACKKGCVCKKDYLRAANGTCIPKTECQKCGANETYLECPKAQCVPRKCSELGFPIACPDQPQDGSCPGGPGCVCIDGFVKDDNDVCIPVSECPSCAGDENKRAGCGVYCNQHCSDIDAEDPKMCIDICYANACDCKPGFYLNSKGDCVKPDQCDVSPTCPANEVLTNCTNSKCDARDCSELGYPVPCVRVDPASCKKGCICKEDYLRAENGTCIPRNECPSCGGDPNAKSGCGVHCGNTCSTYKDKPVACPAICQINGCDCKKNYVYDTNTKKCVLPKDCTPTCQLHEMFTSCANAPCIARNCSQYGVPMPDHCARPLKCIDGCICEKEYLRAENGTCIPQKQCKSSISTTTTTTTAAPSTEPCSDEDDQQRLENGNIDFTLNFLNEMIKRNSGKSIVMSPFSVFIPLAELALYSGPGESYDQLMDALNLNTKDQIRSVFPALISSLKSQKDAILDLAAKIYVSQTAQLTENFENDSLQVFGAKAENIDFSEPQKASDIINAWVEEVTRGLIKDLVTPSMFDAYTKLVLVNAIYFLGNWQTQFDEDNTETEDFYVTSDDTIQVPMMFREGSLKYVESSSLNCKIVEMPYKGGNFSYVIFLPNEIDGYSALAEKVKDPAVLNKALDSLSFETCQLYLPRHEITSSIDLKSILETLNIRGIFQSDIANFRGIFKDNDQFSVNHAVQKATIIVDEKGTEAAAANAIVAGITSVQIPKEIYIIKADHPFLFFLLLKRNPLFCGVYAGN